MKTPDASQDDERAFRRQCERAMRRPLAERIRFGWFRNPDPVRDAGANRAFETMAEYRRFCEERYPEHFGYRRPRGAR